MGNSGSSDEQKKRKKAKALGLDRTLPKPTCSLEDFTILKTVGRGSFGTVLQVRKHSNDKIYAMKILKKDMVIEKRQVEHTLCEKRIVQHVSHPFIAALQFSFQTKTKLYMVFDYFNGGELFHYLSKARFEEERAKLYTAEIFLALEHLHSIQIIYRDLKPENILLDADGHIRLVDFGLSKEHVQGNNVESFVGTPEYLAPEIIRREKYGTSVDWWTLGTLLFEMVAGLPPFYDKNINHMYKRILNDQLAFPSFMTQNCRALVSEMLSRSPAQRIKATEIRQHAFFSSYDWDDVFHKKTVPLYIPDVHGDDDTSHVAPSVVALPPPRSFDNAQSKTAPSRKSSKGGGNYTDSIFGNFDFVCDNALDDTLYKVSVDPEDYMIPAHIQEIARFFSTAGGTTERELNSL